MNCDILQLDRDIQHINMLRGIAQAEALVEVTESLVEYLEFNPNENLKLTVVKKLNEFLIKIPDYSFTWIYFLNKLEK